MGGVLVRSGKFFDDALPGESSRPDGSILSGVGQTCMVGDSGYVGRDMVDTVWE